MGRHRERTGWIIAGIGGAFHGHIHGLIGFRGLGDLDAGIIVLDLDRIAGFVGGGIAVVVDRRGINTAGVVHRAGIARIILLGFGDKLIVGAFSIADLPAEIEGTAGAAGSHPGTRFGGIRVVGRAGFLRGLAGGGVFFEGDAHAGSLSLLAVGERVAAERSVVGLPAATRRDNRRPTAMDV